jgi:hypothetical protein
VVEEVTPPRRRLHRRCPCGRWTVVVGGGGGGDEPGLTGGGDDDDDGEREREKGMVGLEALGVSGSANPWAVAQPSPTRYWA